MITTVAGTSYLFPSQSLPAVNAPLGGVNSVVLDAKGNLYASDRYDNIVVRITPDGTLSVVAGNSVAGFSGDGGPATDASLSNPSGLAVDSAGNLYIADRANFRIREVSGGRITTVAGGGTNPADGQATGTQLEDPADVKVDTAGNLYIAEFSGNRVREVTGGIITTIAGNGPFGFSGDGGPAISAAVSDPNALALDSTGALYIAEAFYGRVRKIAGGVISTVVSGLTGNGPQGLAVDAAGSLYISDTLANLVQRFSNGELTTVAGSGQTGFLGDNGPATAASLSYPAGIALDSTGTLYIADFANQRIRRVTAAGVITTIAGNGIFRLSPDGGSAISTPLNNPQGVAVDSAGNLYIADAGHAQVRKVANGVISTIAGNGTNACTFSANGAGQCLATGPYSGNPASSVVVNPAYVAVDSVGNTYVSNGQTLSGVVHKISGGTITTVAGGGTGALGSGDGGPATSANISALGIAVDAAGNLFIADPTSNKVRKVSNGVISTVAGNGTRDFIGDGGPAIQASLNQPSDVALDAGGNLYIADCQNHRIRKVSGGIITTIAGTGQSSSSGDGGPALSASFNPCNGLRVDATGNLFIADTSRIREISGGIINTVAGNGQFGFSGDGGPATAATLTDSSMALDAAGDIFIADSADNRVREVLAAPAFYQALPTSLSFTAISGGAPPAAQTITLSSSVPGLAYSTSVSDPWLSVSPISGTIPATLQVSADPSQLRQGTYSATVTIVAANAATPTQIISVSFTVGRGATWSRSA